MNAQIEPKNIPDVTLLLGTDASGKDHVANILMDMIHEAGGAVQKRRGFFSGKPCQARDSSGKSLAKYVQERLFLTLYPLIEPVLPLLVNGLVQWDMYRFAQPETKLIVVGHHGLRALAFHLGHTEGDVASYAVPHHLQKTLHRVKEKTKAHVIVLDVDHDVRAARIAARRKAGTEDYFDLHMAKHPHLSERIEARLVRVAQELMGGVLLQNNDLGTAEIRAELLKGFPAKKPVIACGLG